MSHKKDEIESLNVDDLDIEELEHRLELASAVPVLSDLYDCGTNCVTYVAPKQDV